MPSYTFDITEKCIAFVYETIKDMPGNAGQEVLVDRLPKDTYGKVTVKVDVEAEGDVNISSEGEINWRSNHPDAIEIILKEADNNTELITNQATIPGPWDLEDAVATGNWKIVGWDSEWK